MSETKQLLAVTILSPDEIVWEGKAVSVSSENSSGPFDILPEHGNFITMIRNKPITVNTENKETKVLAYKNAVISISKNILKIYIDI